MVQDKEAWYLVSIAVQKIRTEIYLLSMVLNVGENNLLQANPSFIKQNSQIMQVHLECNEVLHSCKPIGIDVAD